MRIRTLDRFGDIRKRDDLLREHFSFVTDDPGPHLIFMEKCL